MKYKARTCPQCKGRLVRRSHRFGFFESVILPLFGLRPYRCEDCYFRYAGSIFRSRRFLHFASRVATPQMLGLTGVAMLVLASSIWPKLSVAAGRLASAVGEKAAGVAGGQSALATKTAPHAYPANVREQHSYDKASFLPTLHSPRELPQLAREPVGALQVTGEVFLGEQPVAGETTVFVGDTVRTSAGATATVRLPEEGILTIGSDTQIGFFDSTQFSADLQRGTVGFRIFGSVKRSRIRVGRYVVVAVPNQSTVGAITMQANGSAHFVCSEGSFGVISLESSDSIFLSAGEEADLSAEGRLLKQALRQTASQPPAPGPPVRAGGGGGGRTAAVILGVGGAAGAVAALTLGKGGTSVSPSAP